MNKETKKVLNTRILPYTVVFLLIVFIFSGLYMILPPENKSVYSSSVEDITISSINNLSNRSITQDTLYLFNWSKEDDVVWYRLEISNDSGFTDIVLTLSDINESNYGVNYTEIGTYIEFILPSAYRQSSYRYYYIRVTYYT